jgi:hypothetical protein
LDAPSLEKMQIKFPWSNEPVSNLPELPRFISRIETFETFDQADIHIHYEDIQLVFSLQTSSVAAAELSLTFLPMGLIEDLTPVVCSFLPPLSRFKCLTLYEHRYTEPPYLWGGDIGDTPLQEILYSFTAVTNIFISKYTATSVSRSMEGISEEKTTAMLPVHTAKYLRGGVPKTKGTSRVAIQKFIAARGSPVTL